MHKVPYDALPEVRERKVFPFRPSPMPSPAPSVISSNSSRYREANKEPTELPYTLTAAGISILAEQGPAARGNKLPRALKQHHRQHLYDASHAMGHWQVENDMNPWLAHENVPKWSTSSQMYGCHYYHPCQTYARGVKARMPTFQCHNRSPSKFNPQAF